MKKLLLIPALFTITVLISFLVFPTIGLAICDQDRACEPQEGEDPDNCPSDCRVQTGTNPMLTLASVLNWIFTLLVAFAGIMIVIAAFYFVTAAGNPETLTKGREFVIYALVGVLVALLARGLLWMVQRMAA